MLKYARIPTSNNGSAFRYTKNGIMTKESKVPHEVMEKFAFTPTVEYDDMPEKRRCIFCDAPQRRQRYLNGKLIDLCEWHYQNARLGQIAAQVATVEKETASKRAAEEATKLAKQEARKKKKTRKTALSAAIA